MGGVAAKMPEEGDGDRRECSVTVSSRVSGFDSDGDVSPRSSPGGSLGAKQRPADTVIIFDWDDTLLCSSAINSTDITTVELGQLSYAVETILQTALRLGETMIVTNGNGTWVQDSMHRFLPRLEPILESMSVVSARAEYEKMYPGDPFSWKRQAFNEILLRRQGERGNDGMNLVVLGDSPAEMEAAHTAAKVLQGPLLLKTVKFKEAPTVGELLGQLRRVAQDLERIVQEDHSGNRGLVQRLLPTHAPDMKNWAYGWRFEKSKSWMSAQAFIPGLWGGESIMNDEEGNQEFRHWLSHLGGNLICSSSGLVLAE